MTIKTKPRVDVAGQASKLKTNIGFNLNYSDIRPEQCQAQNLKKCDPWTDKKSERKIAYYGNDVPIFQGSWKADFLKGDFQKHGVRPTANGLEPTAEDDTSEEYRQQQAKCWIFEGIPESHVREMLSRIRKELEEDRAAHKRKIISTRCQRDDIPGLKKLLPEYLRRKNIAYDPRRKTWQCPNHDDQIPSAYGYFKQDKPVLYCPVCGRSFDIFNVAGLLIGSSDFKMQIQEVKGVMSV